MSRTDWPERHAFTPAQLHRLADVLDALQEDEPLFGRGWTVSVAAPEQVWDRYEGDHPKPDQQRLCRVEPDLACPEAAPKAVQGAGPQDVACPPRSH